MLKLYSEQEKTFAADTLGDECVCVGVVCTLVPQHHQSLGFLPHLVCQLILLLEKWEEGLYSKTDSNHLLHNKDTIPHTVQDTNALMLQCLLCYSKSRESLHVSEHTCTAMTLVGMVNF